MQLDLDATLLIIVKKELPAVIYAAFFSSDF